MINVLELRVGNLFVDSGGNIRTVEARDFVKIQISPHYYSPILLTEKWLQKLGFEPWQGFDGLYRKGNFPTITILSESGSFKLQGFARWRKEVKYVHQLQNLYFALTEEELLK